MTELVTPGEPDYPHLRGNLIDFEILWYSGGPEHAPNRVIGRDTVRRRDLTDAITAACNMLKRGKGAHDGYAHGFYVQRKRDENARYSRES